MKNLFILLTLFIVVEKASGQIILIDSTTNKVSFKEVVSLENTPKDAIYLRAREWFANTFKSSQNVIQMDDKDGGKLIGKGFSKSSFKYLGIVLYFKIWYTINITIKDNKYRIEITDIKIVDDFNYGYNFDIEQLKSGKIGNENVKNSKGEYRGRFAGYEPGTDIEIRSLIESLKLSLSKNTTDNF